MALSALHRHPHLTGALEEIIIIPVPKIPCPQVNNDYRPFALTSNVMKSLERLLLGVFKEEVAQSLDHLQFASSKKRSTSDAICSLMHFALEHLESRSAYLIFIDFSSAFYPTAHSSSEINGAEC